MLLSNIRQEFRIRRREPEQLCCSNIGNRDIVCVFTDILLKKNNIQFKMVYLSNSAVIEYILTVYHNNNVANTEIIT